MNNQQQTEVDTLVKLLFGEHKTLTIPPKPTAKAVGRSEVSLSRDRSEGIGIPHTKLGKGNGSDRVQYNIYDIAKFIVSRKTKVVS